MTKHFILDQIRRTAEKNDGSPLGWRKFFRETGIKESDFLRFWPRYSDAIREAGLTPNAMTSAFGKPALVQKFIELTRELKRLPSDSDLRFKKNLDPDFPSASLFWRHLGSKREQVESVRSFCREHAGYADVAAICDLLAPRAHRAEEEESGPDSGAVGSVYLLKSGRYHKIGRTNSTGRRGRELAIQLPTKSEIIHEISTDDPAGIEAYWHTRFAARRQNGEWFMLMPEDVKAFKRRTFM